jgi:hypothetical protein
MLISALLGFTARPPFICAPALGSWRGPTKHEQVIGDDPEPHPTLHPMLAAVPAAPETMTPLERADPPFTAGSPPKGQARPPRATFPRLARENDVPDTALVGEAFIGRRGKAAVGDGELRGAAKECDVAI